MAHGGDAVCGESIVWIWCGMTDRRETGSFMAKVSDVLESFRSCRECVSLAGKQGFLGKVEHVTVMEVPEIRQWLKGMIF